MKKFYFIVFLFILALTSEASMEKWNNWIGYPLLNDEWRYDAKLNLSGDANTRGTYLRNTRLCGLIAYEIRFHLDGEKVKTIDLVFSNKGDTLNHARRQIAQTKKSLRDDLTRMIGKSNSERIGPARFKTKAEIWKTPEVVFALEADAGEYVILHLYPPDATPQKQSSYDARKKVGALDLTGKIQRNSFGDVYLVVPQVDQGGKGYCVPATYGRILHYYGINSISMHQLAALFHSDRDDGTELLAAHKKIAPLFRSVGINVRKQGEIALPAIKKAIDSGTPLVWVLFADPKYEDIRRQNTRRRGGDPKAWCKNKLVKSRAKSVSKEDSCHMCLIVGYNLVTDEIAVSNSWITEADGQPTWVPFRVAKKYSQGESFLCEP